ncbi:MAG: hypothetical protein LBF27_25735 [Sphingobacterium sp.]|jgi:hypothetical protein|nr:hypothetical protein [Sphingobacterium sp.]
MNQVLKKAIDDAIIIANESTQKEILDSQKSRVTIYTKHVLPNGTKAGFLYSINLYKDQMGEWVYENHTYSIPAVDLHLIGEVTPRIEAVG